LVHASVPPFKNNILERMDFSIKKRPMIDVEINPECRQIISYLITTDIWSRLDRPIGMIWLWLHPKERL
jgi:hypothetical protein